MFCKNCGKEIEDDCEVCPHCGAATTEQESQTDAPAPSENMFCQHCGEKIEGDCEVCPHCGAPLNPQDPPTDTSAPSEKGNWRKVVSLIFVIVAALCFGYVIASLMTGH